MSRLAVYLLAAVLPLSLTSRAAAQTAPAATRPANITVAVLDFDANMPGNPDLGKQIAEALSATLAGEPTVTLVDRAALPRALQELELNLTGLTDPASAAKVGQLVGAKILVAGKAFLLDNELYVTAKMIGTETSLVETLLVKHDQKRDVAPLLDELSKKLATRLREAGPGLVAAGDAGADPVPALAAKLANRKLPLVAVRIAEQHLSRREPAVDPAVETEVKLLLKRAGFTVIEGDDKDLAKAGVKLLISGEAFSEYAARVGNLVSCSARIEMKITPLAGGEVLFTDRESTRAADLSENLAAKSALQKGGRILGIRMLEHFVSMPAEKL